MVKDKVYYVVNDEVKGAVNCSSSKIVMFDRDTKESKIIYQVDFDGQSMGISTLESGATDLYWIEEKEIWEIKRYDVLTNKVNTIYSKVANEMSPNISVVGENLYWYKFDGILAQQ